MISLIEIIVLTLTAIVATNCIAWGMILRKLDNCEEMLEDAEDRCFEDAREAEELQDELDKIYRGMND